MVQPFDYRTLGQDPVAAMQSGMAFGQQQNMNAQNMRLADAQDTRAQGSFEMDQQLFAQQQQDRARAMEAQMAMNDDMVALADRVAAGDVSYNDFAAMSTKYPDMAQGLGSMWEGLATERKSADVAELFKGVTAIKSGRPDLAIQMLEDRATAAENSGDKMEADTSRAMAAAIKADPNVGLTSLGMLLQVVDPDAAKVVFGEAPSKPAGVVELEWRAKQAGYVEGTPEYQEFIRNDGKVPALPGTTRVNADGSIEVSRGEATTGATIKATQMAASTALNAIDDIMSDPALSGVTGALEGGGGNDVDQFGVGKRAYYGDAGLGVIQKIAQLQNTAWLAARDMLKGGGAITDFESKKAEGAMTRLSRAQGDAEFKSALQELRDAITDGEKKLREAGMIAGEAGAAANDDGTGIGTIEDGFRYIGGDSTTAGAWEAVK